MKFTPIISIVLLVAGFATSAAARNQTYSDGTFTNWFEIAGVANIIAPPPVPYSFAATSEPTGGNPGSFLQIATSVPGGVDDFTATVLFNLPLWNSSTSSVPLLIDMSFDLRM